jgi:hypothetical protein
VELTSVRRVKLAYGFANAARDAELARLISAGSRRIATWLKRGTPEGQSALGRAERTQDFTPTPGRSKFYPAAYPIASIASVEYDPSGLYTGDEVALAATDYLIGEDLRTVRLAVPPSLRGESLPTAPKSVRITYTGGLAPHAVQASRAITAIPEAMAAGHYIQGNLSGFIAYLVSATTTGLSFELLAGTPQTGETVTEYDSWDFALENGGPGAESGRTATLGAATTTCLAETHPDIVVACEMHVDWSRRSMHDPENLIIGKDSQNKASLADMQKDFFSLPHVRDLLAPYQNRLVTE